jgi:cysteine desulfurase
MAADVQGLAISTGSACASGSSEPSHVLVAMKASSVVVEGSIRISLGVPTTTAEIDEASRRIVSIANMLRRAK